MGGIPGKAACTAPGPVAAPGSEYWGRKLAKLALPRVGSAPVGVKPPGNVVEI